MIYDHDRSERSGRREEKPPRPYSATLPPLDEWYWDQMREYLDRRELSFALARSNAWYPSVKAGDSFARIVIPATSDIPGNLFWQARALYPVGDERIAKRYQSPSASRGDALIVVWPGAPFSRSVIVEGPMCALAAAELGFLGVALMGATPPEEALVLAWKLVRGSSVVFLGDEDRQDAMSAVFANLMARPGIPSGRMISPYPYSDLAEVPAAQRLALLSS